MIIGSVQSGGDAVISLHIRGANGRFGAIDVIIDTGFNDWITLPPSMIESLSLRFRYEGLYSLADGSQTMSRFFAAELEWLDTIRRILVLEMECAPLLGMAMLRGTRLSIEVINGGQVSIEPL